MRNKKIERLTLFIKRTMKENLDDQSYIVKLPMLNEYIQTSIDYSLTRKEIKSMILSNI